MAERVSPGASTADADRHWLSEAIRLSRLCPPSATAFSVGAVLVAADGSVLSTGYSRENDPAGHAEEIALARLGLPGSARADLAGARADLAGARADLAGAALYSSLEPCAARASRPVPCADLIAASGIRRVVIAWQEPPVFVPGGGAARLAEAGVTVDVLPELAEQARAVNEHLLASGHVPEERDDAGNPAVHGVPSRRRVRDDPDNDQHGHDDAEDAL